MLLSNDVHLTSKIIAIGEEKMPSPLRSSFLQSLVDADPLGQKLLSEGDREEGKEKVKLNVSQSEKYSELYEQKAFAEYKLSYIDSAQSGAAHKNELPTLRVKFNSGSIETQDSVQNETLVSGGSKPNAATSLMGYSRAEIPTFKTTANELVSVGIAPFRNSQTIDKVRVTLGGDGDEVSLAVRDHFSDEKGLSSLVKRLVKSLSFMVSKVFVNGKVV